MKQAHNFSRTLAGPVKFVIVILIQFISLGEYPAYAAPVTETTSLPTTSVGVFQGTHFHDSDSPEEFSEVLDQYPEARERLQLDFCRQELFSCEGRCTEGIRDGMSCSCDVHCQIYEDCCWDFIEHCPQQVVEYHQRLYQAFSPTQTTCINDAVVITRCGHYTENTIEETDHRKPVLLIDGLNFMNESVYMSCVQNTGYKEVNETGTVIPWTKYVTVTTASVGLLNDLQLLGLYGVTKKDSVEVLDILPASEHSFRRGCPLFYGVECSQRFGAGLRMYPFRTYVLKQTSDFCGTGSMVHGGGGESGKSDAVDREINQDIIEDCGSVDSSNSMDVKEISNTTSSDGDDGGRNQVKVTETHSRCPSLESDKEHARSSIESDFECTVRAQYRYKNPGYFSAMTFKVVFSDNSIYPSMTPAQNGALMRYFESTYGVSLTTCSSTRLNIFTLQTMECEASRCGAGQIAVSFLCYKPTRVVFQAFGSSLLSRELKDTLGELVHYFCKFASHVFPDNWSKHLVEVVRNGYISLTNSVVLKSKTFSYFGYKLSFTEKLIQKLQELNSRYQLGTTVVRKATFCIYLKSEGDVENLLACDLVRVDAGSLIVRRDRHLIIPGRVLPDPFSDIVNGSYYDYYGGGGGGGDGDEDDNDDDDDDDGVDNDNDDDDDVDNDNGHDVSNKIVTNAGVVLLPVFNIKILVVTTIGSLFSYFAL